MTSDYTTKLQLSKHYGTGTKTDRSMEQNREPGNKPTHLWSINLRQSRQDYTMEKRVSSANGVGKAGKPHVNQ